jgi:hypothetical protein
MKGNKSKDTQNPQKIENPRQERDALPACAFFTF